MLVNSPYGWVTSFFTVKLMMIFIFLRIYHYPLCNGTLSVPERESLELWHCPISSILQMSSCPQLERSRLQRLWPRSQHYKGVLVVLGRWKRSDSFLRRPVCLPRPVAPHDFRFKLWQYSNHRMINVFEVVECLFYLSW